LLAALPHRPAAGFRQPGVVGAAPVRYVLTEFEESD
jgi:hypothetical protein